MVFEMEDIPADHVRGWKVFVDGTEIPAPKKVELVSDKWGKVTYGFRPEGFDSWTYKMRANAVTLPYCIKRGLVGRKLVVGLLVENRPNMGGDALCVIGGFTDPNESLQEAQRREASEEGGLTGRPVPIGNLMVTDRLFWDASEAVYGGNHVFAQEIPPNELGQIGPRAWRVKADASTFKDFKKAQQLVFLTWEDAVQRTQDGIALAALARLRCAYDLGELG